MVGEKIHLDRDMKKPGRSDHFPERTECKSWLFIMSAGTKLKGDFKISSPNSKFTSQHLDLFKGYNNLHYKCLNIAAKPRNMAIFELCNVLTGLCITRRI